MLKKKREQRVNCLIFYEKNPPISSEIGGLDGTQCGLSAGNQLSDTINARLHGFHIRSIRKSHPVTQGFFRGTCTVGADVKEVPRHSHNVLLQASMEKGIGVI